jgi:hypothetical protein
MRKSAILFAALLAAASVSASAANAKARHHRHHHAAHAAHAVPSPIDMKNYAVAGFVSLFVPVIAIPVTAQVDEAAAAVMRAHKPHHRARRHHR